MGCSISPRDVQLPRGVWLCISFVLVSHSSFDSRQWDSFILYLVVCMMILQTKKLGFQRQKDWLTSNRPVFLGLQKSENQDRPRTGPQLQSSPVLRISGPDRSESSPGSVFLQSFN